jgi:hypothetical protein
VGLDGVPQRLFGADAVGASRANHGWCGQYSAPSLLFGRCSAREKPNFPMQSIGNNDGCCWVYGAVGRVAVTPFRILGMPRRRY